MSGSTLRQPFRALFGVTELLMRFGLSPSPTEQISRSAAERQLTKPPFWMTRPGDPSVTTREDVVAGRGGPVRVRTYVPAGLEPGRPVIVYLHGGGFVMGGLDGCDYITRGLASRTGFAVVSVEYRLAPECPFPGPLEDCEDALHWVVETAPAGCDTTRVAVAGDSAGGNLAAALCLQVRESGPVVAHQTLVYPFLDGTISATSWETYGGCGVDAAAGRKMVELYAPGLPTDHPLVGPLHHPTLEGLPPALVVTASYDVLHDDGVAYVERLRAAGVPVRHRDVVGVPHGFVTMPRLTRESDRALDLMAREISAALTTSVAR